MTGNIAWKVMNKEYKIPKLVVDSRYSRLLIFHRGQF